MITYPVNLPSSPSFTSVVMIPRSTVSVSRSPFTGQQQVQEYIGGQWWEVQVDLPRMKRAQAQEWLAFLLSVRGMRGTFLFGDPSGVEPLGSPSGSPVVDGAGQTGNELDTRGWPPFESDLLLPGDYIQIGSGETTRLYRVVSMPTTQSDGGATIDIWPSLRDAPVDGSPIVTSDCKGVFRLASNEYGWTVSGATLFGFQFSMIEAI